MFTPKYLHLYGWFVAKFDKLGKVDYQIPHLPKIHIPYRTKIRWTKLLKFRLGVENFVWRNILSVENFVQYFNTKVRQRSHKIVEILAWCRKFCPTKNFVRRKLCPMFQYKSQVKIGKKCGNFGLVSKILSDEIFCPSKILFDEILSDKVYQI